jgi:hypothetical protein
MRLPIIPTIINQSGLYMDVLTHSANYGTKRER